MYRHVRWAALAAILVAIPALAQDSAPSLFQRITAAGRLPTATREARQLGVPESDLQNIFRSARDNHLSAVNLVDIFTVENDAIRQNGRIDNFGSFVQGRLAAGLRGRDLADAIHAEHARRGMGKGTNGGGHADDGISPGHPGSMGTPANSGKQGGKPESPGKPDSPGKSGENGKKGGK